MGGGSSCLDSNALVSRESPTFLCPDFDPLDVVALATIEGFGPVTVREQLERIRSEGRSIDDAFPRGVLVMARKSARAQMERASRLGARCVIDGDADFPLSLRELDTIPTHIWA